MLLLAVSFNEKKGSGKSCKTENAGGLLKNMGMNIVQFFTARSVEGQN